MAREILYNTAIEAQQALLRCTTKEQFLAVVNQISTEVVRGVDDDYITIFSTRREVNSRDSIYY